MPSADVPSLPPWLTRQYDYAQGFRGIGRGLAQGYENAAVQQQVQARQLALQEQAQQAAMRRQGMAQYQQRLQQYLQDPQFSGDPEKARIRAYTETAHLLSPDWYKQIAPQDRNELMRLKNESDAALKSANLHLGIERLQSAMDKFKLEMEQQKALAEMRDKTAQKSIEERKDSAKTTADLRKAEGTVKAKGESVAERRERRMALKDAKEDPELRDIESELKDARDTLSKRTGAKIWPWQSTSKQLQATISKLEAQRKKRLSELGVDDSEPETEELSAPAAPADAVRRMRWTPQGVVPAQ